MAQTKSHSCEQFDLVTFKILSRRNSFWFGANKLQYQIFKYIARRRIANTDIKVLPFGFNCWEKGIVKKNCFYIELKEFDCKELFVKHMGCCFLVLIRVLISVKIIKNFILFFKVSDILVVMKNRRYA